jgi:Cu-Zn family superoxide dismutase
LEVEMTWTKRARRAALPALAVLAGLSAAFAALPETATGAKPGRPHPGPVKNARTAVAVLHGAPDHPKVSGTVMFVEEGDHVWVVASIQGVDEPGRYGFHLHEVGRCSPDPAGRHFASAGGHFNPAGAPHGCLDAARRHAGDLGNVTIEPDGTGRFEKATEMLALAGPRSVLGRSIVLHAGADDCTTQPAGNSGARMACGVVQAGAPRPKPAH